MGEGLAYLATVPVAVQAATAVTVFCPGTAMREGHAPGPAGPPDYDHCGEKEEARQRIRALEVHALTTTVTASLPSWHLGPERPGGQLQRYPLISSTHVAP